MHTKKCLAAAVICAVENIRDNPEIDDRTFAALMAGGNAFIEARGYLADGIADCRCEAAAIVQLSTSNCWCKPVTLDDTDTCTTCGHRWTFGAPLSTDESDDEPCAVCGVSIDETLNDSTSAHNDHAMNIIAWTCSAKCAASYEAARRPLTRWER